MKQKLPRFMRLFGCITTRNDEYIILFHRFDYKIYVLNTTTMQCRESRIGSPTKGRVHFWQSACGPNSDSILQAINMDNKESIGILCGGYIKQLWNTNEFNNLMRFPFCLTDIITKYAITAETVHIIYGNAGAQHWKINVDDILTTLV
eukprot:269989_1